MRGRKLAAAALLASTLLWTCGIGDERFNATGTVVSVDAERGMIKVSHDEIRGFMPAMTMSFDVAPEVPIENLESGDAVRFVIARSAERLRIVRLERGGPGARFGVATGDNEDPPLDAREAPSFRLVDQEGRPFELGSLRGKAVLLDFIFTTCTGPCPILTTAHARLQRRVPADSKDRVHFVSITVDPANDTPAKLKSYAHTHGADLANWTFLTGGTDEVDAVLRSYHVGHVRLPDGTLNHTVVTYLIDPDGHIRNHYLGLEYAQDALIADLLEILS